MTPQLFDRAWFAHHQRALVAACNVPGLGRELRAALGVQADGRLLALWPHASVVRASGAGCRAEVRGRPTHARRLAREYRALWAALHWFDHHIANPVVPALNLGFDLFNPNADPETTSVDGQVERSSVNEVFATIRAGNGTTANDTSANISTKVSASTTTNQFDAIVRGIFLFDTSILGALAAVSGATFSLYVTDLSNFLTGGNKDLYLCPASPASNTALAAGDFQTCGHTDFGSIVRASLATSVYNDLTVNAAGQAAIALTGITKYSTQLGYDQQGTFDGTWASTGFVNITADSADGTNDPKLAVSFSRPVGFPYQHLRAGSGTSVTEQKWQSRPRPYSPGIAR